MMSEAWLWLSAAAAFCWVASLVAMRFWTKRQVLRRLSDSVGSEEDISLPFDDVRPEDKQALEVVRAYRRRSLLKVWPDTDVTFRSLLNLSLDLIQQIAALYHPTAARPELHASLAELLSLQTRISVRLQALLETMPLRAFKDLKLQTIISCRDLYQVCVTHPAYQFLRQHRLDKAIQWVWMVKNFTSPWYWGRRAAYSGGRELLARFFVARVITIVGVEAIRLYSGRAPGNEKGRLYEFAWQAGRRLLADDPLAEARAVPFFLRLVLKSRELPEATKLSLVDHFSRPGAELAADPGMLAQAERRQVERWLRRLIREVLPPPERPARLLQMQQHLAKLTVEVKPTEKRRSKGR